MDSADEVKFITASIILTIIFCIIYLVLFGYTGRDDSHITYFPGEMLSQGHGIVNYNGDKLEQSSTLLFVIALGIATFIAPQDWTAADLGPILSVSFAIMFFILLSKWIFKSKMHWLVSVAIGLQTPFIYWSLSGMENSLYALLLLCFIISYANETRYSRLLAVISALISLVRPEGFIVILCTTFGVELLRYYSKIPTSFKHIGYTFIGIITAFLFKTMLGLGIFPLPVYAKQDIDVFDRLISGLSYFRDTFTTFPILLCVAFVSFLFFSKEMFISKKRFNIEALTAFCIVLATGSFALLAGGDWMENGRFLVVTFLFSVFLGFLLLNNERLRILAAGALVIFSLYSGYLVASSGYGGVPIFSVQAYHTQNYSPSIWERYSRIHSRDIGFTDRFLDVINKDLRDDIVIGSVQAGFVPYFVILNTPKDVRFVDFVGLSSEDVHSCGWGYGGLGGFFGVFYENLENIHECGLKLPDYIFDLDNGDFDRMNKLISVGCEEIFKESLNFTAPAWKKHFHTHQFLVQCNDPG